MIFEVSDSPVAVGKEDREYYNLLKEEELFKKADWKDIFMIAFAIGFRNGLRRELSKQHSGGLFRRSYLMEEDKACIAAVAVCEESPDLLLDGEKIIRIAEEYAHAGIGILYSKQESLLGTFEKDFEREILQLCREIFGKSR